MIWDFECLRSSIVPYQSAAGGVVSITLRRDAVGSSLAVGERIGSACTWILTAGTMDAAFLKVLITFAT